MAIRFAAPRPDFIVFILVAFLMHAEARAQDAAPTPASPQSAATTPAAPPSGQKSGGGRQRGDGATTPASPAVAEQHRLPPDSTTKHTLALPGRTLAFTATAGSIRLFDDKGEPQADIAYTSYTLDGADQAARPVASASPDLVPNAETWLDFTDLVFIDPVGTGYSRFVTSSEDARKRFYSVD